MIPATVLIRKAAAYKIPSHRQRRRQKSIVIVINLPLRLKYPLRKRCYHLRPGVATQHTALPESIYALQGYTYHFPQNQ